jgi:hypothetical protein
MNKRESDLIIQAIDGLVANLQVLGTLVVNLVSEPQPSIEPAQNAVEGVIEGVCTHIHTRNLNTHGGSVMLCDDCGSQVSAC